MSRPSPLHLAVALDGAGWHIFQVGDSDEGREFAAASADAIFSLHSQLRDGQAFYTDVKRRLARYGRHPDQPLILPAATFVLAGTDAEAQELAREVRSQQVSGQTAIKFAEQLWNRDLSGLDPDGKDRALVADRVDTQFAGSPGQVADQLGRLRDATGADELIITTITHQHADRVRSFRLPAGEWARR